MKPSANWIIPPTTAKIRIGFLSLIVMANKATIANGTDRAAANKAKTRVPELTGVAAGNNTDGLKMPASENPADTIRLATVITLK